MQELREELAVLEEMQRTDPHRNFWYLHGLTRCFSRSTVKTRFDCIRVENPRGTKRSYVEQRSIDGLLDAVCEQLNEDISTFMERVCDALHRRPARINELRRQLGLPRRQRWPTHRLTQRER
jgi:hypothetical protein